MAGDYTRFTFGPQRDYSGVFKQQGRVDLDADFNELIEIVDRRWRSETIDIIGHCIVPNTTPDAFLVIPTSMGDFDIGIGRMYVDGIQVENHGRPPLDYQADLGELRGTTQIPYSDQPYLPLSLPPALAAAPGTTDLVYIDVWQREVTVLEDPSLREIALGGPDTTTRIQSVWQVRALQNVGRHGCGDDIAEWNQLVAPSAGRLTTSAVAPPSSDDPCIISPSGGYRGLENRLYRVEIHGPIGGGAPAKFKWSRNNGTIASSVSAIPSSTQIIVQQIGRDQVLRFRIGDWIEITDDFREFQGLAGHMAQVTNIDEANRVITFNPAIPGVINFNAADPTRHTRVRRWDQTQNVDANGLLDVVAGSIDVEDGIRVTFNLDPAGGSFKSGDYWVFAARTADGSIEILQNAPPRGILHHFCRLGFIHWGADLQGTTFTDCREHWPPSIPEGGDNCACTVCVTPQAHASGQLTVQMAINQVIAAGGGTVCLEVGNYLLRTPVQIQGAKSVKLVGKGIASQLVGTSATGAVMVNKSRDIVLDTFSIQCRGPISSPQEAVRVVNSSLVRIEHLEIRVEGDDPSCAAISLAGALMTLNVSENVVQAPIGIRSGSDPTGAGETGLADVRIENNEFDCTASAIAFTPVTVHQLVNRICGNRINGCIEAGLLLTGVTVPGFGLEVQANVFSVLGHGIVASLNGLRVLDNDLLQRKGAVPKQQCGVLLTQALTDNSSITDCQILGNRIQGFVHAGISIDAPLHNVMIKQNHISRVGIGLMLVSGQVMDQVSIENNQFNDIAGLAIMGKGEGANYAATGNQIRTRSQDSAVILVFNSGDGIFSHNECYREGSGAAPDVHLQSSTLIVGNNRVIGGRISLDIRTARLRYTVLGNICHGKILVESGSGINLPWAPLNLEDVA